MFTVTRTSAAPASPMRVLMNLPDADGNPGFSGAFSFDPAGTEDGACAYTMDERQARAIMDDPGMAPHFECSPELPKKSAAKQAASVGAGRAKRSADDSGPQNAATEAPKP